MLDHVAPRSDRHPTAEPFSAVLIASEALAGTAAEAIALAGGRVAVQLGWREPGLEISRRGVRGIIVVESEGVDHALLADLLPRVDAVAIALDLQMVVVLDEAAIDVVASSVQGPHVQLLCSPSQAERVASLAVAAEMLEHPSLSDSWRESEAERLQRLNQEVARIAEVLAKLTREDRGGSTAVQRVWADRQAAFGHDLAAPGTTIDAADVRRAIRARRLRDSVFGAGLFEDPAWDMLLDLFAAELEHTQVSVSSLCIAAAVAPTTALRWIGRLTDAGLFERQPDPFDRRRAFMALSERASQGMHAYLASLQRAGLSIA